MPPLPKSLNSPFRKCQGSSKLLSLCICCFFYHQCPPRFLAVLNSYSSFKAHCKSPLYWTLSTPPTCITARITLSHDGPLTCLCPCVPGFP